VCELEQDGKSVHAKLRLVLIYYREGHTQELLWCNGPGGWETLTHCRSLVGGLNPAIVILTNTIIGMQPQLSHTCDLSTCSAKHCQFQAPTQSPSQRMTGPHRAGKMGNHQTLVFPLQNKIKSKLCSTIFSLNLNEISSFFICRDTLL
jgi:hypothetical protein